MNELTVLPVEEQISNELVKANVTEAKIAELREKYMPLKINGIEDKETYIQVKEARKDCKSWRVLAEKLCKKGREEAVAIQKAWVAKEKEVTTQIGEVEDYLEKQEKDYEEAVAKAKKERDRRIEEQFILRQQELSKMNALYAEGQFIIGEVSFEMSVVKECDPDIWENDIKPKFESEYKKVEALVLEQERLRQEREAEIKRQEEELQRKQRELEEQERKLKAAQEEQERKQREEEQRKIIEENQRKEKLWRIRLDQLNPIGWNGQEAFAIYDESVVVATYEQLITWTDNDFTVILETHQSNVKKDAEEKEQKRLAEIEKQKEAERVTALRKWRKEMLQNYGHSYDGDIDLGKYEDVEWDELLSKVKGIYEKQQLEKWEAAQEEKRKQEELKRQQELEQSKDKEKWEAIMQKVNGIEVYDMRSSQYRKKAMILREKLEEIKAL